MLRRPAGRMPLIALFLLVLAAVGAQIAASTSSAASGSAQAVAAKAPSGDWPTFGHDSAHSGVVAASPGITAGNLGSLSLRTVRVDGVVDSAPVELGAVNVKGRRRDVVVVTTTYGRAVAIDPRTGARLWEFVPHGVNATPGNSQVTTASPVADPNRRFVYSAAPNGVVYKLSLATGRRIWARAITFDPRHEKIASALTVSGSYVVAVTGGYIGDIPPYDGHVVTINRSNGHIAHVWNTECSSRHRLIHASSCSVTNTRGDNAIWGRPGAVIEPGSHRILVATGNGPFDGHQSWGDSVLELSSNASRLLHNWTPSNQAYLDAHDVDLGSASPALLPTYHGYRLVVQAGKDSLLHLLNLNRLDGTKRGAGPRLGGQLGQVSSPGHVEVLSQPAVGRVGGRIVVFASSDQGTGAYELVGGKHPRLRTLWSDDNTPGTSPVVTGGLLYIYDEVDGRMIVRQPLSGHVLRSLPAAAGHWNSPLVASGRIIEPTGTYHLSASSSVIEIWHRPGY